MSKRAAYSDSALGHPSTKRAKQVDENLPYDALRDALVAQSEVSAVTKVVHWFRSKDLRMHDNTALHHASQLAQRAGKPLLAVYLDCPAELAWHGTSPARVDFLLEGVRVLRDELKARHIPLVVLRADARADIVPRVAGFVREHGASHVFANFEYEVDELRRDVKFVEALRDDDVQVAVHHDQTVVEPGTMLTGAGTPMKVFTPYHRAWLAELKRNPDLLDTAPVPAENSAAAAKELRELFDSPVPTPTDDHQFASDEDRQRVRKLWPAGHDAGLRRLDGFLKRIDDYAATRSNPAADSTSRLSAYLAAGMLSAREALARVRDYNRGAADFTEGGACSAGVHMWVREICFRELYRQTLATTPHLSMNLPVNLKFDFVRWDDDSEAWQRWVDGRTGEPFVDAGMRQLRAQAWMHNRLRMVVSSYLSRTLLLDYRRGERFFASTLVDWDLANNTQGWQPSYTVFNPVSQAERNDPAADYIRRWVPELRDVPGKAVFAPYARLSNKDFDKLGYPRPMVDWKEAKEKALSRFKEDMRDVQP